MAELRLPSGPAELLQAVRKPLGYHLGGEHHLTLGGLRRNLAQLDQAHIVSQSPPLLDPTHPREADDFLGFVERAVVHHLGDRDPPVPPRDRSPAGDR